MKHKKIKIGEQFLRIGQVIQSDKAVISDSCKSLVLQDFTTLLSEYFEISSPLEMDIVCENGIYRVQIRFDAERVKKFNVLK